MAEPGAEWEGSDTADAVERSGLEDWGSGGSGFVGVSDALGLDRKRKGMRKRAPLRSWLEVRREWTAAEWGVRMARWGDYEASRLVCSDEWVMEGYGVSWIDREAWKPMLSMVKGPDLVVV